MPRRREPTDFLDSFAAVRRRVSTAAAHAYATLELGTTQAKLLKHIGEHNRISQAELARATDSDPTLTGRVLQPLLERGLVRRERSDEDRREYVLELTATGRRLRARVGRIRARLAARAVAALDERDLDDFERIAGKVLAAFDAPKAR